MTYAGLRVSVGRIGSDDSRVLRATFPEVCHLSDDYDSTLVLMHGGEVVGVRPIEPQGDRGFEVEWDFTIPEPSLV